MEDDLMLHDVSEHGMAAGIASGLAFGIVYWMIPWVYWRSWLLLANEISRALLRLECRS